MRRKCPRTGDIVRWLTDGKSIGWVMRCEGIHIFEHFFEPEEFKWPASGVLLRRDSVEVASSANSG